MADMTATHARSEVLKEWRGPFLETGLLGILIYLAFLTHYNRKIITNQDSLILSTPVAILGLAEREGNVTVLDHVLDLSPHCLVVSE